MPTAALLIPQNLFKRQPHSWMAIEVKLGATLWTTAYFFLSSEKEVDDLLNELLNPVSCTNTLPDLPVFSVLLLPVMISPMKASVFVSVANE